MDKLVIKRLPIDFERADHLLDALVQITDPKERREVVSAMFAMSRRHVMGREVEFKDV